MEASSQHNTSRINIFWFRRDLRLEDNAALYHALKQGLPVLPIFIFDQEILDKLDDKVDARVEFIQQTINALHQRLVSMGSTLEVHYGKPNQVIKKLLANYSIEGLYANHDYEPSTIERDNEIAALLKMEHIPFHTYKDIVIFEKNEVVKEDGKPYTVFTPYSKKWRATVSAASFAAYPTQLYFHRFIQRSPLPIPSLASIGFSESKIQIPKLEINEQLISHYTTQRDFPAMDGTSRLGIHLRFGTISIRALANTAIQLNTTFLNELIWRDFYHMILWQFPRVGKGLSFKPAYDHIEWRQDNGEFNQWCNGQTGYPILDAGMRELNQTGFMHNRVRMIVASFLTKHLLLDWRLGEAYFANKLLDYDLAANNGGWQWAAGCGCDAAPYFRIFNPYLQTQKFDAKLDYIKKWVPEFQELNYPKPMVVHEEARKRCLAIYAKALKTIA